ncbi:flagellar filament capping protein FliD [Erythrobacter sp. HL-111]|uniref:flagellar filament capping protein FliD n=1 Tax=Erythrobacter sp. HL-111 TaxID=1798193 RepID=UPI0006DBCA8D|nr:flagellar filament capping protein FliD [Erythrobacter sp. HL-111]KPP92592.1 MAG: flagellar filament capping protein FliD [Erythrobacteraceae bacterium HL-111]SDS93531.1 flagellar hook-associated protein 2 [Erythrobacter sp. HL-111]
MDNPGASILSALGGGSGINFMQLADDLAEASYGVQRDRIERENETLEARISAASLLRSTLTGLASALGDRIRGGDVAPRAAIGDPAVARVATTPGVTPSGSFSLEVTQLARGQTLVSRGYASADAPVGQGTLTIRFGRVDGASFAEDTGRAPLDLAVGPDDTLADLAARINGQAGGALNAYVATGADGAQLVIKGEEGAASGFVLEPASAASPPEAVPGDLSYLAWSPASDAGELRATARDAEFELDTVARSSPSNRVTGLPGGMTLDLAATNIDAPTTISFADDPGAIAAVMGDVTAALNDLVELLAENAAVEGGTLGSDAGARELRRDLQGLTSRVVMPDAAEGEPSTLADLGLSLNRDGTFRLDNARLSATLEASPDGAAAMFTTGVFGVFATIDQLARDNSLSSDPGSLGGSVVRFERLVERGEERLARIEEQQAALRERLTRSFVRSETRIAASQSTLDFLRQTFQLSDN